MGRKLADALWVYFSSEWDQSAYVQCESIAASTKVPRYSSSVKLLPVCVHDNKSKNSVYACAMVNKMCIDVICKV